MQNIVDEVSEVVFILVTASKDILSGDSAWKDIVENVTVVSKMKVKDNASLTNKTVFKYMDICDNLNKK